MRRQVLQLMMTTLTLKYIEVLTLVIFIKDFSKYLKYESKYTNVFSYSKGLPTFDPSFLIHSLQSDTSHPIILYPSYCNNTPYFWGNIQTSFFQDLTEARTSLYCTLKLKENKFSKQHKAISRKQENVLV